MDLSYFTERGSGPPLLLVHGLMVTGEMFEPVIDSLASRHRVIVPDLRGHGRSRAEGRRRGFRVVHSGRWPDGHLCLGQERAHQGIVVRRQPFRIRLGYGGLRMRPHATAPVS
jgi:pimeloyl-ACP methyl ester carboxylesterase